MTSGKSFFLIIFFSMGCSACQQQSASTIDEKLVDLYTDLVILNEEYKLPTSTLSPELYQKRIQEVLKNYDTTREAFTDRIQALSNDPETFRRFHETVSRKLQERGSKIP